MGVDLVADVGLVADADLVAARLLLTIPASVGAWAACATWTWLVRAREPWLRSAIWWWPILTVPLLVAGLPAGTFLGVEIVAPVGRSVADGWGGWGIVVAWAAGSAVALVTSARRRALFLDAVDGAAALASLPEGLAACVGRCAARVGVPAPRVVAVPGGGTAFVCRSRGEAVLVVPVELWGALGETEREALVLHEIAHVRRRDPEKQAVISVVLDLLWPAFGLRLAASRLAAAWEESADAEAVRGGATRSGLARTLVAAWEQEASVPFGGPAALAFSDSAKAVASRLEILRATPGRATLVLRVFAILLLAPWCPAWAGGTSSCRVERASPSSAAQATEPVGRVHVRLGAEFNPAASFLFRSFRSADPHGSGGGAPR